MDNPAGVEWVTIEQLLAYARERDPTITERAFELWRSEGLLPHPHRIGHRGKAPIYGFPAAARLQLDALLFWRHHTKNPDWLRVVMWVDGWPIELGRARASLITTLTNISDRLRSAAESGRNGQADNPAQLLGKG